MRPGEKIHEEMITASDSLYTVDLGRYMAILPNMNGADVEKYAKARGGQRVAPGFAYESGSNPHFLTVGELRQLIAQHVPG